MNQYKKKHSHSHSWGKRKRIRKGNKVNWVVCPLKFTKKVHFGLLTCSQSGQNQSPSGMTMIGGRRHALWYPASHRSHSSICTNTTTLRYYLHFIARFPRYPWFSSSTCSGTEPLMDKQHNDFKMTIYQYSYSTAVTSGCKGAHQSNLPQRHRII